MPTKSALVPDYTALSTAAECLRKYQLRYEERVRSPETNWPMKAGSALHKALNVLYTDEWNYAHGAEALAEAYGDVRPPPSAKHSYLTLGHLKIVLRNYVEMRNPEDLGRPAAHRELAEEAVVFDWANSQGEVIRLGGKIDLPSRIARQHYIVDFKCTTQWVNSYWALRTFALGHQTRVYAAALQTLTGVSYDGAYIDGIYMGPYAADGPEKWQNRKSVPSKLFGPHHFTPAELDETWEWAKTNAEMIEWCRERGVWPQDESSCGNYGGCEYLKLCRASPAVRRSLIERKYETWEPTGRLLSGADGNSNEGRD